VALRYDDREVVVGPLSAEPDPHLVDLCSEHAGNLIPPVRWRLVDLRVREPLGA
jgi:hypothetical protein